MADNLDLSKFIAENTFTVSEAMKKIDNNANGIVFFLDDNKHLIGSLTDGDVRRHLLKGGSMISPALDAANKNPKFSRSFAEAKKIYHNRDYIVIPIVDAKGVVIGLYSSYSEGYDPRFEKKLDLQVVINAGGQGTRLYPLTKVLPKPLIPVGELPILEHIMKEYQRYNCNRFNVIVNYKKELIKSYFRECENHYDIDWYDEDMPLGTGGGLRLLKGKLDKTFFFANCDVLLTSNYSDIVNFHKENNNTVTMVCAYKNLSIPYGVVDIGVNGVIKNMREKPLMSFLTNTGIYLVEPNVINDIKDNEVLGFPDIIERERKMGKKVAAYPVSENEWMDMGQFPELQKMRVKLYGE
jgi:dTDP-glucose pyrophosphorylase